MDWIIGSFFAVMVALLVYSIITSSFAIRKEAQPSLDTFFEALYAIVLPGRPLPRGNRPDNSERK